jgi:hypothetical protein
MLCDCKGKPRTSLTLGSDASAQLCLIDQLGKVRARAAVLRDGLLALEDGEGQVRALLAVGVDGSPTLRLFDGEGLIWEAP